MAGINRATEKLQYFVESRKITGVKCVFISHQQNDKDTCRKIADYLMTADIDVYFDEDDRDLKYYRQNNNPNGVVECIKKGINNSTHLLIVVSPNTLESKWVPWEIGYGYDKTELSTLTLKGILDNQIPDYMKTTKIVRGTKSLNQLISLISGKTEFDLIQKAMIKESSQMSHPLDNYLNFNL